MVPFCQALCYSAAMISPLSWIEATEAAALASTAWIGRGDRHAADQAAVDGMRTVLDRLPIQGTVVIGEGERDEAPMLYIGEQVGTGWRSATGEQVQLAVDPLEGTNLCATGAPGALAVLAAAWGGGTLLHAPDTYMAKMAVSAVAKGAVDLRKPTTWNIAALSEAKRKPIDQLVIAVLDRERHHRLVEEIRHTGARILLLSDGDVSAALLAALPNSGVDALLGTGGAPEGVLAAAALRCLGAGFQGRLVYRNEDERSRAETMGILDHDRIYTEQDLATGDVLFAATGVTSGVLLPGIEQTATTVTLHSLALSTYFPKQKLLLTRHKEI